MIKAEGQKVWLMLYVEMNIARKEAKYPDKSMLVTGLNK